MGELKIHKECRKKRESKWKISRKEKIKALCWSLGGVAVGGGVLTAGIILGTKPYDKRNIEITNRFINRFKPNALQTSIDYYKLTKSEFLDKDLSKHSNKQGLFDYAKTEAQLDDVKRENAIENVYFREDFRPESENGKIYPLGTYVEISTPPQDYQFVNKVNDPSISWMDYLINNKEGKIWIFLYKQNVDESAKLRFFPEPETPPSPEKPEEQPKIQQVIKREER